jgi:hypothetical protein
MEERISVLLKNEAGEIEEKPLTITSEDISGNGSV